MSAGAGASMHETSSVPAGLAHCRAVIAFIRTCSSMGQECP